MTGNQGDMKKRLVQFATGHLDITVHRFEKSCGLSNSYCSNPNAVGSYARKKIMDAYPELNIDWVITGKGGMLNTNNIDQGQKENNTGNFENTVKNTLDDQLKEQVKELKKELELYKMLYEKEHEEVKAMSEQIGALKAELNNSKKECSKPDGGYSGAGRKRKAS